MTNALFNSRPIGVTATSPNNARPIVQSLRRRGVEVVVFDHLDALRADQIAGLVVDDLRFWNSSAHLADWIDRHRTIPVVVCAAPNSSFECLTAIPWSSRVRVCFGAPRGVSGMQREALSWLLRARPACHVLNIVLCVAKGRAELSRPFVEAVVTDIEEGSARSSVDRIARHGGQSRRTLERRFKTAGLPPPREVLDWCRLLYVALLAEYASFSLSAAGRHLRLNATDLFRLKRRLLPDDLPGHYRRSPASLLDLTIIGLTQRLAGTSAFARAPHRSRRSGSASVAPVAPVTVTPNVSQPVGEAVLSSHGADR